MLDLVDHALSQMDVEDDTPRQRLAIVDGLTPVQREPIADESKRIVITSPRRVGKTTDLLAALVEEGTKQPESTLAYIALTIKGAKVRLWRPAASLSARLNLGLKLNTYENTITLPNGSVIMVRGAKTLSDVEALRGPGYAGVVIDEAQSIEDPILYAMFKDAVEPAVLDTDGWVILAGTPKRMQSGLFYSIGGPQAVQIRRDVDGVLRSVAIPWKERTDPKWAGVVGEWSLHRWSMKDAAIPGLWERALAMKARKGWADDNPTWRREYLGEWVGGDASTVYRYDQYVNSWKPGPKSPSNPFGLSGDHAWRYVCGMDLGLEDPFALQIAAYAPTCPVVYHVYEFFQAGMEIDDMAREYYRAKAIVGDFDGVCGDTQGPTGRKIADALIAQHGIPLDQAKKREKFDYIELINSDLHEKRMFILSGSQLEQEMTVLERDITGKKVARNQHDHCSDAWLYTWRDVYHRYAQERPTIASVSEVERALEYEKQALAKLTQRRQMDPLAIDGWQNPGESGLESWQNLRGDDW